MNLLKKIFLLSFTCLSFSTMLFAQVEDNSFDADVIPSEESLTEGDEDEIDDEATIIEVETSEAQELVDKIYSIVDLIEDFRQQDTLIQRYAIYNYSPEIGAYLNTTETDTMLVTRFDVVVAKDENEEPFTYVKEYVYSTNQAWDYIYERLYDKDSKLCYFVRHYNTYNSGCAEVAFEQSEYFFDSANQLIKKTYSIYDSNNTPLDYDACWMEREAYEKYSTFQEFIQDNPIPITLE